MTPPRTTMSARIAQQSYSAMIVPRVTGSSAERPLLIIDGDNLAHRAYHSMPKSLKSADGRPINAILGWTNMLVTLWENEQPRSIFVAWDTLGIDTYRHKLWPTYQGGRVFDTAIVKQLDLLPTLAVAFGFGIGKRAGYEADDFMAAAAIAETRRGGRSLLPRGGGAARRREAGRAAWS